MSGYIWETFDGLFKTVYRQERRVVTLEQRIADLERRLQEQTLQEQATDAERASERASESSVTEFPAERAA